MTAARGGDPEAPRSPSRCSQRHSKLVRGQRCPTLPSRPRRRGPIVAPAFCDRCHLRKAKRHRADKSYLFNYFPPCRSARLQHERKRRASLVYSSRSRRYPRLAGMKASAPSPREGEQQSALAMQLISFVLIPSVLMSKYTKSCSVGYTDHTLFLLVCWERDNRGLWD